MVVLVEIITSEYKDHEHARVVAMKKAPVLQHLVWLGWAAHLQEV